MSIENAVLATFVVGTSIWGIFTNKDLFELDEDVFTSTFRKRLARYINRALKEDKPVGSVLYTLEGKYLPSAHVNDQNEWLDMLAQNALPIADAKFYCKVLKEREIRRRMAHGIA